MIIWVASFPRSGNTFLRILLHELYGVPTHSGPSFRSGDDISLDFPDRNPTGNAPLPASVLAAMKSGDQEQLRAALEALHAEPTPYFIKTHASADELPGNHYPAIVLVRDGRDAMLSLGWYVMNVGTSMRRLIASVRTAPSWRQALATGVTAYARSLSTRALKLFGLERIAVDRFLAMVSRQPDLGDWSSRSLSWMNRPDARTSLVRFEDLIARPVETVTRALAEAGVELPRRGTTIPTFDELKRIHPEFFRSGSVGGWKKGLKPDVARAFTEANREGLRYFGYVDEPA